MSDLHTFMAYLLPNEVKVNPFIDKDNNKGLFVYRFGTIVCWNLTKKEIKKIIPRGCKPLTSEDFILEFVEKGEPRVEFNKLILNTFTFERIEVVAMIVGQSVALEYFERKVQLLQKKPDAKLNFFALNKFIARVNEVSNTSLDIVTVLRITEKPEALWNDQTLDELYEDLRETFDLSERYATLRESLNSLEKRLDRKISLTSSYRSFILEMWVVIFFLIEVIPILYDWIKYFLGR